MDRYSSRNQYSEFLGLQNTQFGEWFNDKFPSKKRRKATEAENIASMTQLYQGNPNVEYAQNPDGTYKYDEYNKTTSYDTHDSEGLSYAGQPTTSGTTMPTGAPATGGGIGASALAKLGVIGSALSDAVTPSGAKKSQSKTVPVIVGALVVSAIVYGGWRYYKHTRNK